MSTTAFFDIESAFQTELNSIAGKPTIEFENMLPYSPSISTRFWRTNHIPGQTLQVTADGMRQHSGTYRVEIIVPTGKGLKTILNDMDSIAGTFDTVNSISSNGLKIEIQGVSRSQVQREDGGTLYGFVNILYTCYSY